MSQLLKNPPLWRLTVLTLCSAIALVMCYYGTFPVPRHAHVSFGIQKFMIGRSEMSTWESSKYRVTRKITYGFGPLCMSRTELLSWMTIGTNQLRVGEAIYDPTSKRELWRVLAVEENHQFEDDSLQPGVRVRSSVNGATAWLPRKRLGKAVIARYFF